MEYILDLEQRRATTRKTVEERINNLKDKQKKYNKRNAKHVNISEEDIILVRKVGFDGKQQIQDRLETKAYTIIEQPRLDISELRIKRAEDQTLY